MCICDIIQHVKIQKLYLYLVACGALVVCACDLQPKIASIPDNIGMFIEDRYPALLADPETQPEIYNSAVTDYGVYASPELYGSENIDDYVLYASTDDYVLIPEPENTTYSQSEPEITSDIKSDDAIDAQIESDIMTDYIIVPTYGGNPIVDDVIDVKTSGTDIEKNDKQPGGQTPDKTTPSKPDNQPTQKAAEKQSDEIIVARGDTVYALAKKHNMSVDEFAKINDLKSPYTLKIGQKLTTRASIKTEKNVTESAPKKVVVEPKKEIPNIISAEKVQQIKTEKKSEKTAVKKISKSTDVKRVDLDEITVAPGDTLYSISRKYEIPVNDLAVMNKISAPFNLSVGQKLRVPNLNNVRTKHASEINTVKHKSQQTSQIKNKQIAQQKQQPKQVEHKITQKPQTTKNQPDTKNPEKQKSNNSVAKNKQTTTTKIPTRSSSKFSWPVRGRILSGYGPKSAGLVNDGINISANMGTAVHAAENGVVAYAGNEIKGMGNLIIIQHSDGWMTVYAHLNTMNVRRGTRVSVGQNIGTVGKTGKVDKPQLHFEIRRGTKSYNPTQYLKK